MIEMIEIIFTVQKKDEGLYRNFFSKNKVYKNIKLQRLKSFNFLKRTC